MRPLTVMVVEDEDNSRESLRLLLDMLGYSVRTASNGEEALARVTELGDERCVMLLDLFMPVLDGWHVYEQLQATGRLASIRVLVTTSAPHLAPPGAEVMGKPIDVMRLCQLLDDARTK